MKLLPILLLALVMQCGAQPYNPNRWLRETGVTTYTAFDSTFLKGGLLVTDPETFLIDCRREFERCGVTGRLESRIAGYRFTPHVYVIRTSRPDTLITTAIVHLEKKTNKYTRLYHWNTRMKK